MDMPQEHMHKQRAPSVLVFSHSHTGAILQDLFLYFCRELAPEKGELTTAKFHSHGFCYVFASADLFRGIRKQFPQMRAGFWDESKKRFEELQPGEVFPARGLFPVQEQVPTLPILGSDAKPSNPKDNVGSTKLPFHLWPETATALGCLGLLDGELKYGRSNFRAVGVRASVYVDACRRHLAAWFEGEDADPDSGVPHLGHALACLAILVEAQAADNLNDDRMFPTNYRNWINTLTPYVVKLQQKYADRQPPIHYTIRSEIPSNLGARSE